MTARPNASQEAKLWVRTSGRVAAAMLGEVNIAQYANGALDENIAEAVALIQTWSEWDGKPVPYRAAV